jgi:hypothetical protein
MGIKATRTLAHSVGSVWVWNRPIVASGPTRLTRHGRIIRSMAPRRLIPATTVAKWEAQLREAASKAVAEMHGNVRTTLAAHGVGPPSALVAASGKKKAATIGAGIALGVTVWKAAQWASAVATHVTPVANQISDEAVSAAKDGVPTQTTWGMPSPAGAISAALVTSVAASGAYLGSRLNSNVSGAADPGQAVADVFDTADSIVGGQLGASAEAVSNAATYEVGSYVAGYFGNIYTDATSIWNAEIDDRTRQDHLDADGQEVNYNESFIVGGESLLYPGDPAGSAEQTENCRCWLTSTGIDPSEVA